MTYTPAVRAPVSAPQILKRQSRKAREITPTVMAELDRELFTIYDEADLPDLREEAEEVSGDRAPYTLPYLRYTQELRADVEGITLRDGSVTRNTSIAVAFPSAAPHTLIHEIDMDTVYSVMRTQPRGSDAGGVIYAVGHRKNGMTLAAIGRYVSALMLPGEERSDWGRWRRLGNVANLNGEFEHAMLFLNQEHVLASAPRNARNKVRAISRNYWAIERDRLRLMMEVEVPVTETETRVWTADQAPDAGFTPVRSAAEATLSGGAKRLGMMNLDDLRL